MNFSILRDFHLFFKVSPTLWTVNAPSLLSPTAHPYPLCSGARVCDSLVVSFSKGATHSGKFPYIFNPLDSAAVYPTASVGSHAIRGGQEKTAVPSRWRLGLDGGHTNIITNIMKISMGWSEDVRFGSETIDSQSWLFQSQATGCWNRIFLSSISVTLGSYS